MRMAEHAVWRETVVVEALIPLERLAIFLQERETRGTAPEV